MDRNKMYVNAKEDQFNEMIRRMEVKEKDTSRTPYEDEYNYYIEKGMRHLNRKYKELFPDVKWNEVYLGKTAGMIVDIPAFKKGLLMEMIREDSRVDGAYYEEVAESPEFTFTVLWITYARVAKVG